jgi:integrase
MANEGEAKPKELEYTRIINGMYYFRLRIPLDIRHYFPADEILVSLKTKDRGSAEDRVDDWRLKCDRLFTRLRLSNYADDLKEDMVRSELYPKKFAALPKKKMVRLADFIKTYKEKRGVDWRPKTEEEVRYSHWLFLEIVGNKPFHHISFEDVEAFQNTVKLLPPNMTKSPKYRDKNMADILVMPDAKPMSTTNVRKYMGWVSSLFNYAIEKGLVTKNPVPQLKKELPKKKRADKQRDIYTQEELQKIFDLVTWRKKSPSIFWATLVMIFQGCRENEICQMEPRDIVKRGTIWCLNFNEDETHVPYKHMKTDYSERVVPIHPFLISIGFLDFVEYTKKQEQVRLFMELRVHRGEYSHKFTRRYSEQFTCRLFDEKIRVLKRHPVAHSLRHNFCDYLMQKLPESHEIRPELISGLVGHDVPGMIYDNETINRYAKEFRPVPFLKTLQHLNYDQDYDLKNVIAQADLCLADIGAVKPTPINPQFVKWVPGKRRIIIDDFEEESNEDTAY